MYPELVTFVDAEMGNPIYENNMQYTIKKRVEVRIC